NPYPIVWTDSSHPFDNPIFYGLAFADATTAYTFNQYEHWPGFSTHLYKLTKSSGKWAKAASWFPSVADSVAGLVVDPSSNTRLFTVYGYRYWSGASSSPSYLQKIDLSTGSPVVSTIGSFTGFAVTGLAYGPPLNQISSPGPLPIPPPFRPPHMSWGAFEVI